MPALVNVTLLCDFCPQPDPANPSAPDLRCSVSTYAVEQHAGGYPIGGGGSHLGYMLPPGWEFVEADPPEKNVEGLIEDLFASVMPAEYQVPKKVRCGQPDCLERARAWAKNPPEREAMRKLRASRLEEQRQRDEARRARAHQQEPR